MAAPVGVQAPKKAIAFDSMALLSAMDLLRFCSSGG
jgi:hypothetical protein